MQIWLQNSIKFFFNFEKWQNTEGFPVISFRIFWIW